MMDAISVAMAMVLGPRLASAVACQLEQWQPCEEVQRIVETESSGVLVGVHTEHAHRVPGSVFWRRAVSRGLLDPERCPGHAEGNGAAWGPRGVHGLVAAYSVHVLGECVPPEALDVPLVSAVATVRRLRVLRDRYRLRTEEERALAWRVGVGAARRTG